MTAVLIFVVLRVSCQSNIARFFSVFPPLDSTDTQNESLFIIDSAYMVFCSGKDIVYPTEFFKMTISRGEESIEGPLLFPSVGLTPFGMPTTLNSCHSR